MMRSSLIKKNWASGVTLLEVMLVIAIAGSILAMGISQYQSMQRDSNVRQVQANVDTLFNAMAYWYKANCGRAAVGGNTSGYLSPYNPYGGGQFSSVIALHMYTLTGEGYLTTSLLDLVNSIVSYPGTTDGYVMQFNPFLSPRCTCMTNGMAGSCGGLIACNAPAQPVRVGTLYRWTLQVSILLNDTAKANAATYLAVLNGDCLSSLSDDGVSVKPCNISTGSDYVVWERSPSMATQSNNSTYGQSLHQVQQFNQVYTTYPLGYLGSTGGVDPTGQQQYFLCGG